MASVEPVEQIVARAVERLNAEDLPAAESLCREILDREPGNINARRMLGLITRKRGELERSLEYFRDALRLNDRKGVLHFEVGTALLELERPQEAYDCFLKAIELEPALQPAYVNLSAIMERQERFAEAIPWARKAVELNPNCGLGLYNLANAQRELGQLHEAIDNYTKSLRQKPDHAKTLWNLGICHLLMGNFEEGWPLFERRQDAREVMFDTFPQPRWDGSPLAGRTIVVHAEQGIGDEVLFASCFSEVIRQGGRCILVCDPRLVSLWQRSFPETTVYGHARRKDWQPPTLPESVDVQIPAGSLPALFRPTRASFPRRRRFLATDPRLEAMWSERLTQLGPDLKVGISWRAGGKPTERRKRALPLARWGEIFAVPGVQFVNLQYGDALEELAEVRDRFGVEIHDWEEGDPLVDVDSYIAKIATLDLVISVGNATVHMAGAIGTPAWTLLPMVPSWRWMIAGEESPWYSSVRLFRQPRAGEWQPVLDRVTRMLRELVGGASSRGPEPSRGREPSRGCESPDAPAGSAVRRARPVAPVLAFDGSLPTASMGNSPAFVAADKDPRDVAAETEEAADRWLGRTDLVGHAIDAVVAEMLDKARRLEETGELAQAEAAYREVLQLAPRQLTALCGLGIVARKTGRPELAIRSFRRALAVFEPAPEFHLHLADALVDAGRFDEAVGDYRRALKLNPSLIAAQVQVGRVLSQSERHAEAQEHFGRALAIDPHNEAALLGLGNSLLAGSRMDEAIEHLEQAVQLRPQSAAAQEALAAAYCDDGRLDEAEWGLREAITLDPWRPAAHYHLGRVLAVRGRLAEAAAAYQRTLQIQPDAIEAVVQLAGMHRQLGQLDAAVDAYRRGVALAPENAERHNTLGVALLERGGADDLPESLRSFDEVLRMQPNHGGAHLNRAFALFRSGHLAEGWREYEWRWHCGESGGLREASSLPVWDGSPLAGRRILIAAEQAPSDEVLFASCYGEVIAQAAGTVILCEPRLASLMWRSFPKASVYPVPRGRESQWRPPVGVACDVRIAAGSLPLLLRPTRESFLRPERFLTAEPQLVAAWRARLAGLKGRLKVGIAWRDSAGSDRAAWRRWRPLLQTPGICWVDLHEDSVADEDFAAIRAETGATIHRFPADAARGADDFDDLAARISSLDLVIAAGGTAAHLAGALGARCWILSERPVDWRWLADGEATPWYAGVRVFQLERMDDAEGPGAIDESLLKIDAELLKFVRSTADNNAMGRIPSPHWSQPGVWQTK